VLAPAAELGAVLHRDQDDRDRRQLDLEVVREPDPILVGQVDIDHHHVRLQAAGLFLRQLGGVRGARYRNARLEGQQPAQVGGGAMAVVNDDDPDAVRVVTLVSGQVGGY